MNKKILSSILLSLSILIMAGYQNNTTHNKNINRMSKGIVINTTPVINTIPDNNIIEQSITPTQSIETYYHKQMDYNEYSMRFLISMSDYSGDNDLRLNFCGETTLLNILDIMSMYKIGQLSGLSISDLTEKYLLDDFYNPIRVNNNEITFNPNGSMTSTSIYHVADMIGLDTGLYKTSLLYGNNDSKWNEPIPLNTMPKIVSDIQNIANKNGALIATAGININNKVAYYHFVTVLDAKIDNDGTIKLLIVDSMGKDKTGFYGWVDIENYFTSGITGYTGIYNLISIIPTNTPYHNNTTRIGE